MFSLQNKIRFYIVISIIIYAVSVIAIVTINIYLTRTLGDILPATSEPVSFLNRVIIFQIILAVAALIYGTYVFFASFMKGLNRYRDIQRRVAGFSEQEVFDLKSIEFPNEDEFGDLGSHLNSVIFKLQRFEELKVQRIKVEKQMIETLAERMEIPVLVVKMDRGDKIVRYYNSRFETVFARKRGSSDQFYELRDFFLSALVVEQEKPEDAESVNPFKGVMDAFNAMSDNELIYSFIDKEFEDAINISIADRTITTIKKDVRTINGEELWHSDRIEIVPAWNDYGQTLEVTIFFHQLKQK